MHTVCHLTSSNVKYPEGLFKVGDYTYHMIFSKVSFQLFQGTSSASAEEPKSFCSKAQESNKQKPQEVSGA
jgi:hypothetical protein